MKTESIQAITRRPNFQIVKPMPPRGENWTYEDPTLETSTPLASFFYAPKSVRSLARKKTAYKKQMSGAMKKAKFDLLKKGAIDLSYSKFPDPGIHGFLTISFTNTRFGIDDIHYLLDATEAVVDGKQMPLPKPHKIENTQLEFPNYPFESYYAKFLRSVFNLILNYGIFFKRMNPPSKVKTPEDLEGIFKFELPKVEKNVLR